MKLGFGKDNDQNSSIQSALSAAMSGGRDAVDSLDGADIRALNDAISDASNNTPSYASNNTASSASSKRGSVGVPPDVDLTKLKKKDLLEIMLRQGEEIDALREEVADLRAQLDNKQFQLSKVGSIAEASLAVTEIFKEADKAAMTYLANIQRLAEEGRKK